MNKIVYLVFCLLLCVGATDCYCQTDTCVTHLKDANNNHDQGNYDEAITLLNSTIEHCALDKTDKIQAYKLLIMCYISVDNLEAADVSAMRIINLNPNYMPDKFKDDPKLINLFKKFKPNPIFAIGFNGGINMPVINTVHSYSIVYPDGQAPEAYNAKIGFQLGLYAERLAYRNLWVHIGFTFRSSSYEHILYNIYNSNVYYSEKLTYLDFPVSLKYYIPLHRFRPYLEAGAYASILSNSLSTTTRDGQKDIINRAALRNTYHLGYMGGAGICYNTKSFLFTLGVRYAVLPENVNKEGSRYKDEVNLYKYNYLDNDFTINSMQVNVGASIFLSYKNTRIK